MDPYLEQPRYWEPFHDRLIFHIGSILQETLPPDYVADFRQRVQIVLADRQVIPDVTVSRSPDAGGPVAVLAAPPDQATLVEAEPHESREEFVEILHIPTGQLVAVLELASPTNKVDPRGREAYREKQRQVLASDVHLIEIDLLRSGGHWAGVPEHLVQRYQPFSYLACVSRAADRNVHECYFRTVRDPLPAIAVPLLAPDADATLLLQAAFDRAYDQGRHRGRLDYSRPALPRLAREDEDWAEAVLRNAGLRPVSESPASEGA